MDDIALLVFVCVTANHLGLVEGAERVLGFPLHVINCCKCLTFWATLVFCKVCHSGWLDALAISFLASYSAIWLELLEGYIDTIYNKVYEIIYKGAEGNEASADTDEGDTDSPVP